MDPEIEVVYTDHFQDQRQARSGSNLPNKAFDEALPQLKRLAWIYRPDDCMVTIGGAKVLFKLVTTNGKYRLVFITVMPDSYKHNAFKIAKTHNFGRDFVHI